MEQDWNLQEIIEYYKTQGAAKEQPVLIELLREVQEQCGGERCQKNACGELHRFIGEKYRVKNGDISSLGGFTYKVTGCMKNCTKGPSLKWDGKLYSNADKELIQALIEGTGERGSRKP